LLALFFPTGAYQTSNQVFIDQWKSTINFFGQTFTGKTLIMTAGLLVNFKKGTDDGNTARDAVWAYFVDPGTNLGSNLKGFQTSNLRACRMGEASTPGFGEIKQFSRAGFIGGAQFGESVVVDPVGMGDPNNTACLGTGIPVPTVSPNQAARGTLAVYFDQTAVPSNIYCNIDGGCNHAGNPPAVLNFLQIYSQDFDYVALHPTDPLQATIAEASCDILTRLHGQVSACMPTTLSYNGAVSSDFNDSATVSATMTSAATNAPIPGATISFVLAGDGSCTGPTDTTGTASCGITPSLAAGAHSLTASFAGNTSTQASAATAQFVITREETTVAYSGPTVIANAQPLTLSGVLKEDGSTPINGRAVAFTLGSGGTAQTCTGTTNASGAASCTINPVNQPLSPGVVNANFAGDTFYLPSPATANTLLFAFLAGESFVVGDKSDTGSVTFWASQWANDNMLSGGPAPNSFKGFAATPSSNPPGCGGTYTTGPANSIPPPASVPSYMGVIVSSSVTQSGPTISGDVKQIVIVTTNPGYAPNPGHVGTGTVVAIFCG
jgi:hypothetical protein